MTGVTVTIWHNVARDQAGRHTAPLDGFTPGDPMVRVFTYLATPRGRPPEAIAEDAFALANGHPRDAGTARLSRLYYQRRLRSLFVGDAVSIGEAPSRSRGPGGRHCVAGSQRSASTSTAPTPCPPRPRARDPLTEEGGHD